MEQEFDKIITGAGLYGLYSARLCGLRGEKVLVLEYDPEPFMRATYINQARVHMGYHYPRSLSTAVKSAHYYRRFHEDFGFCIRSSFDQIYATSGQFSWTNAEQFVHFCEAAGIRCEEVPAGKYFRPGACDGAFLTEEDTYDAHVLRDYYLRELAALPGVKLQCSARIAAIRLSEDGSEYIVDWTEDGSGSGGQKEADQPGSRNDRNTQGGQHRARAPFLLNATYASTNQVLKLLTPETREAIRKNGGNTDPFGIKYELCEIILCRPSEKLRGVGLTVMDGPFFSIMPFGQTPYHSLTAVTFTPHVTSYEEEPRFSCQEGTGCSPAQLHNCNTCVHRPSSAWAYMSHLADKYLLPEYAYEYERSLFSMKPILKSSEVDDSRPTAIRVNSTKPVFISVLSGKINTVYDLDRYL